jgi:glycosyltransferase involved in cell wall biosynthesis
MRIAMLAPLEIRVPPVAYGGTEVIVSLLTEELVRRGHEVTLFASGDSVTTARLEYVCTHFLRGTDRNKFILNMLNVASCLEQADKFDIIHNHTETEGMSTAKLVKTPMLTTLHGNFKGDQLVLFAHYRGWWNTISQSARSLMPAKEKFAGVIYNAIDVKAYPFNGTRDDSYLLFLSRMSYEKGVHVAIEAARKMGRKLIIAGNIDKPDEEYFKTMVLPGVDGDLVRFIGEADFQKKMELMMGASCLLAPLCWEEPFGLFMIEAMACGAPVIAFRRGSAPEVVKHKETGFIVDNIDGLISAVDKIPSIDRRACREHVERNFDAPRLADDYLRAYNRILSDTAVEQPAAGMATG